jgi:integrase
MSLHRRDSAPVGGQLRGPRRRHLSAVSLEGGGNRQASLMSADGVPIEEIARLAGHNQTATTELVYRHELRPVIATGAEVMDRILSGGKR